MPMCSVDNQHIFVTFSFLYDYKMPNTATVLTQKM